MSSAPDPGWPHPPAGPPAASLSWRVLHSWWLLLPILGLSCLGGFGFLYVGLRARRPAWWISGIVYTLVGWAAFLVSGEFEQGSTGNNWAIGTAIAVWAATILHGALINSAWLRWRAGYRPWYAQSAAAAPWSGGAYPPGPLAPPPGGPGHPVAAPAGPYPPTYPPAAPAYAPGSPAFPPTAPAFPPPSPEPTMATQPPGGYVNPGPVAAPVPSQAARPGGPVDVNTARMEEFAALPGFDPQRARHVLDERHRRGGFGSLAEFAATANLAPHEYARLRDVLVCAPPTPPGPGPSPHGRVLDV
ncbi:helix-hairpin-helix domain-containing protein [Micromonospora sp. NPDC047707]|uniref:ComEA family DNA-binding protein n=1 Tax=unclassified Micromonospora TaxID=2617518 RepID=UPI0018AFA757|nr:helix-hairpin-helix domain-containing protein [Micromonospora sp. WMMC415]